MRFLGCKWNMAVVMLYLVGQALAFMFSRMLGGVWPAWCVLMFIASFTATSIYVERADD